MLLDREVSDDSMDFWIEVSQDDILSKIVMRLSKYSEFYGT